MSKRVVPRRIGAAIAALCEEGFGVEIIGCDSGGARIAAKGQKGTAYVDIGVDGIRVSYISYVGSTSRCHAFEVALIVRDATGCAVEFCELECRFPHVIYKRVTGSLKSWQLRLPRRLKKRGAIGEWKG